MVSGAKSSFHIDYRDIFYRSSGPDFRISLRARTHISPQNTVLGLGLEINLEASYR